MKFAFCLFKYFPYGGLQKDFLRLASTCLNRGHQVDVFTISWTGNVPEGIQIKTISPRGLTNHRRYLSFAKKMEPYIRAGQYDAVVGFNKIPGLDVYFAGDVCYAARAAKKNIVYRLSRRCRTLKFLEQSVFGKEAKTEIISIADTVKKKYISYYNTAENRFHPVPPWIPKNFFTQVNKPGIREDFRSHFLLNQDTFLILMVGSGFKTKGVDRAIKAVAALPYQLKQKVLMTVVGKGKTLPYQLLAKKLGIFPHIHFVGQREDVARFLAGADLLLHPAYHEAAGSVLIEAMAAGLPVLATDVCGFGVYVQYADAGRLVPSPFEQKTLNNMLASMISSHKLVQWGQNGKKYIETTDTYDRHERATDIIEKVAREKPVK